MTLFNKLKWVAGALVFLLAPSTASAIHNQYDVRATGLTAPQVMNDVACNASEATRTWTSNADDGQGYAVGIFQLNFTYNAATALTATCSVSMDGQTTWAQLNGCDDTTDGVCTLQDASWTKGVTANENIPFRVDFLGYPDIKCVITCTGGGASDTFDLFVRISDK